MRLNEFQNNFSDNFRQWFHGSIIVDRSGKPLRVLHGTRTNFSHFEVRSGQDTGIYFTTDPSYAAGYASSFNDEHMDGSHIRMAFLSIKKPFFTLTKPTDIEMGLGDRGAFTQACIDELVKRGHDGVISNMTEYEWEQDGLEKAEEIVAFSPTQVRDVYNSSNWS